MNNCPCKSCICVAICQSKKYSDLIFQCELIWEYLAEPLIPSKRRNGRLGLLCNALKPINWYLIYDEFDRAMVNNYTGYENCHFIY